MASNGKVLVGEPVDETSRFLASARVVTSARDIEAGRRPHFHPPPPPHGFGFSRPGLWFQHGHGPGPGPGPPEEGESCARLGCLFSWIPPVGFVTFIANSDAAPLSPKEYWAHKSCLIATVVTVTLILYFAVFFDSEGSKAKLT